MAFSTSTDNICNHWRACLLLSLGLWLSSTVSAEPLDAETMRPALTDFFEATGGEDWHRNDGWLDETTPVCDWYGVGCTWVPAIPPMPSFQQFRSLDLADNNLQGRIEGVALLRASFRRLNLSNNVLQGPLDRVPYKIERVDLSGNQLFGPLPDPDGNIILDPPPPPVVYSALRWLDLSRNQLTGAIPQRWQVFSLDLLDLSSNELEGSIAPALAAMTLEDAQWPVPRGGSLRLADNAFSGPFEADWIAERQLLEINLCWTDVIIDDPELEQWLDERHEGGPRQLCMERDRVPVDLELSGSWYNPERAGEGLTLMMLEDGTPLVYWFSHISRNRQLWLFNSGASSAATTQFMPSLRTRGSFEQGFGDVSPAFFRGGSLRLDRVEADRLHAEHRIAYTGYDLVQPGTPSITWPPMPDTPWREDLVRLSQLAGTRCDNQTDQQWISGAWYAPDRAGQGFIVEALVDGRGVVYWFTYTPEGSAGSGLPASGDWQAWMTGDALFDGDHLLIDPLFQPADTEFAAPADLSNVTNLPWGTLLLEFHDDLSGHAWFTSDDPAYGSSDFAIARLARPLLAECESD